MSKTAQPLNARENQEPSSGFASIERAARRNDLERVDDAHVRKACNALAVVSPLVDALIDYPGPAAQPEVLVAAARNMLESATRSTNEILSTFGIEPNTLPWAHHRVLRVVSSAVAASWRHSAKLGMVSADISALLPAWLALANTDLPEVGFVDLDVDECTALRITFLEALRPVMHEVAIFNMFRDPSVALRDAAEQMLEACNKAAGPLAGELATPKARRLLVAALLRNAGELYASSWRKEAERAVETLIALSPDDQRAQVAKNPEGLPTHVIKITFLDAFDRLAETVAHLTPRRQAAELARDGQTS
jgi:hypothetical protein